MDKKKILYISILISFAITIVFILLLLDIPLEPFTEASCGCHRYVPNYYYLILSFVLLISIMPIFYYFISRNIKKEFQKQLDLILKITSKGQTKDQRSLEATEDDIILKLLTKNEKEVIKTLLKHKRIALQADITRESGLTKLKVHRAIKSLENKGVVKTEHFGKTNKIILDKKIFETLKP